MQLKWRLQNKYILLPQCRKAYTDITYLLIPVTISTSSAEAINNIVKHSECSSLELSVREINNTLEFSIADNGKGFNEATIQKGNGLANMKSVARKSVQQ